MFDKFDNFLAIRNSHLLTIFHLNITGLWKNIGDECICTNFEQNNFETIQSNLNFKP